MAIEDREAAQGFYRLAQERGYVLTSNGFTDSRQLLQWHDSAGREIARAAAGVWTFADAGTRSEAIATERAALQAARNARLVAQKPMEDDK